MGVQNFAEKENKNTPLTKYIPFKSRILNLFGSLTLEEARSAIVNPLSLKQINGNPTVCSAFPKLLKSLTLYTVCQWSVDKNS